MAQGSEFLFRISETWEDKIIERNEAAIVFHDVDGVHDIGKTVILWSVITVIEDLLGGIETYPDTIKADLG
jgi:hypothetical protein